MKHKHVVSSDWEVIGPWEKLVKRTQLRKPADGSRGLAVQLETQSRVFFPSGKTGSACCDFERTVLKVYGEIRNANDVRKVIAQLQRLEPKLVEEYRK